MVKIWFTPDPKGFTVLYAGSDTIVRQIIGDEI